MSSRKWDNLAILKGWSDSTDLNDLVLYGVYVIGPKPKDPMIYRVLVAFFEEETEQATTAVWYLTEGLLEELEDQGQTELYG